MKRPGPLLQMTLALVGLCGTLVLLADLFFAVLPDRDAQAMRLRKTIGEAMAVQVATLLQTDDQSALMSAAQHSALQRTLDGVVARTEGVRSAAVRRSDTQLLVQAGDHAAHWRGVTGDASDADHVVVPLSAGGVRWGRLEMAFQVDNTHPVLRWLRQPLVVMMLFMSAAGALVFGLYVRRALQHLDPASVIPERVQGAFDVMAEGVAVLDAKGRVLLTNKAFRVLHPQAPSASTGKALSELPWLGENLPADPATHPWARATAERTPNAGLLLEIGSGGPDARRLVINCAPITDPGGSVRGCLATFTDVSALHHANDALRDAMSALTASKDEVQRQNVELERLATRDPLTGCLNRRALLEAMGPLLEEARQQGKPLACAMLDIDHFKAVNDTHGHAIGDRAIQEVAKKLHDSARSCDLVGRYGGEEFVIIAPGLDRYGSRIWAERLRRAIEQECGPGVREVPGLRITASVGVDMWSAALSNGHELIDRADQALYRAKRAGRNRVKLFTDPVPSEGRKPPTDIKLAV